MKVRPYLPVGPLGCPLEGPLGQAPRGVAPPAAGAHNGAEAAGGGRAGSGRSVRWADPSDTSDWWRRASDAVCASVARHTASRASARQRLAASSDRHTHTHTPEQDHLRQHGCRKRQSQRTDHKRLSMRPQMSPATALLAMVNLTTRQDR